jgi:hypothetical protein
MSILVFEMAANVERQNRIDRSDRDRLVSEATSLRSSRSAVVLSGIRRLSGGALIGVGTRLQGRRRCERRFTPQTV